MLKTTQDKCTCGSKKNAAECCSLIIQGKKTAETPEQLMRSRYTAYTQANIDYIQKTMVGTAAKNFDAITAKAWANSVIWLGLLVKRAYVDPANSNKGFVEFEATFKDNSGKTQKLCELSEFEKIGYQWFYTNGQHINQQ